jgi:heme/copper-type cytochrome/quinol oxidase subunit 1
MTTIDTRPDTALSDDDSSESSFASFFAGVGAWFVTTDHKRIGRMYLGVGMLGLVAAAVIGLVLGLERADDTGTILEANALLQTFQSYRMLLVFAAILPLVVGLSVAVVPMQLGARSIAFPRLVLTGFYSWLGGLGLTVGALAANGGIGGGDDDAVDLFLAGHGLMVVGLLASAGCVANSVLTTRAPGMTMRRIPLFAWSALVGALGMLLLLPVVFGLLVLLFLDHRYARLNFGGSEGIAVWVGWMYTVPAVAVFSVPAIGVAAELTPVTFKTRQPMRGVMFTGIALIGVTALAAVTQQFVHEVTLDTTGTEFVEAAAPMLMFTGLPLLGVLIVLALMALTAKDSAGRPNLLASFVFAFFGLGMISIGLLGNFVVSITDLELIGTSFEEGATLYFVYGSALAVLGGVAFWAPKLWGRTMSDKQLMGLAMLGVVGTILAALPLYIAGFFEQEGGVPANDADVAAILSLDGVDGGTIWVTLSVIGHGLVALTILGFVGLMLKTFTGSGDAAGDNPYGGQTIEWSTPSPTPAHNYEHVATVASSTPQFDLTHEGSTS